MKQLYTLLYKSGDRLCRLLKPVMSNMLAELDWTCESWENAIYWKSCQVAEQGFYQEKMRRLAIIALESGSNWFNACSKNKGFVQL